MENTTFKQKASEALGNAKVKIRNGFYDAVRFCNEHENEIAVAFTVIGLVGAGASKVRSIKRQMVGTQAEQYAKFKAKHIYDAHTRTWYATDKIIDEETRRRITQANDGTNMIELLRQYRLIKD